MANKRTCLCCRTQYHYCSQNCDDKNLPIWHNLFHNQNCHDIWYVLSDFENGVLTKEEARENIKALDISVIKNDAVMASYRKLMEDDFAETPTEEIESDVPSNQEENIIQASDIETKPETKPLTVSEELKASSGAKGGKTRQNKKSTLISD